MYIFRAPTGLCVHLYGHIAAAQLPTYIAHHVYKLQDIYVAVIMYMLKSESMMSSVRHRLTVSRHSYRDRKGASNTVVRVCTPH